PNEGRYGNAKDGGRIQCQDCQADNKGRYSNGIDDPRDAWNDDARPRQKDPRDEVHGRLRRYLQEGQR
ncbi:hypothetical protein ABTM67_19510, partial [Acinetobacter baumannii]